MTRNSAPAVTAEPSLKRPLAACRQHFALVAGTSAVINVLYLAPTLYMLQVYDRVVPADGLATLAYLTLLLLCSLGALAALEFVRSRLLVRATLRLERTLAEPLLAHILAQPGRSEGAQRLRDFDILRQAATGAGFLALCDAPWTLIYIGFCFLLNPMIGALAAGGTGLLLFITLATERATRPRLNQANDALSVAYASQAQSAATAGTISALGMGPAIVRRHQIERLQAVGLQVQASLAAGKFMGVSKFFRLSLQSLALGLAAYLALGNHISVGAIFAASLLIARALAPLEQLLGSWRPLTEAYHAYGQLRSTDCEEVAARVRTQLPPPTGRLFVEQVTVLGAPGQTPLLLGLSFALEPGTVLGLIGPSGAGKSTLARALVGALRPNQGRVRLDGADISDWAPERLGIHIGYLPQDLGLLPGTVKQNICRFQDQMERDLALLDGKAIEAARACGAHEMILQLPGGYDTVLGPGGAGVSLGQAQRIALARALFGRPQFVVLDEPNAHLDRDGEIGLIAAIKGLKTRGAAVIVVAHRNSVLEAIDELLLIANGRVVMRGPRDAVLSRMNPTRPAPAYPAPERKVAS